MAQIKIKEIHKDKHIAFGGVGKTKLGQLDAEQLKQLAIIGLESGNKNILSVFEGELPALSELKPAAVEKAKAAVAATGKSDSRAIAN